MRLATNNTTPSSFLISIISIACYFATHSNVAAFSISVITSCPSSIHHLRTSSTKSTALSASSSSSSPSSCSPSGNAGDTNKNINNDNNYDINNNDMNNSNDKHLKDRRSAISTVAGIITAGIVAPKINHAHAADESQQQKKKQTSLYTIVDKIEKETYFGLDMQKLKNKEPLYKPNSNGAPEKHLPQVTINGNEIELSVNHVMTDEHYIQFIWLREVESGDVVVVKACTSEEEKAFLKVRVPNGVTLTPCLYCNLHGLWKGEPFTVV